MGLRSDKPLIALPGLHHLRITLFGLVLGGGHARHDGSAEGGALAHEQAPLARRAGEVGWQQRLYQALPWHLGIHPGQKSLSAGGLLLVLSLGERDLLYRVALSDSDRKASTPDSCSGVYAALP